MGGGEGPPPAAQCCSLTTPAAPDLLAWAAFPTAAEAHPALSALAPPLRAHAPLLPQVSIFYTAPTAIRALHAKGDSFVTKHSRKSLRLLGSVGEPINPGQ